MTRRSRRSLPHLFTIAGATGLLTLAVAVTGADPVWLAVGPLLLVVLDTLAFSPIVQSRTQKAGRRVRNLATPEPHGIASQLFYMRVTASRSQVPLGAAVGVAISLVVVYHGPVWSFVSGHVLLLSVVVGPVAIAIVATVLTLVVPARELSLKPLDAFWEYVMSETSRAHEERPVLVAVGETVSLDWLQQRLTEAADRSLSVLVIAFDGSVETLVKISTAIAPVAVVSSVQVQTLSTRELILVGPEWAIHSAAGLVRRSAFAASASPVSAGEAVYPRDGHSPEALIATARTGLAPHHK